MENELIVYNQKPLTAEDVRAQVNLIQEVMKKVMQKGQHYGIIPGCGDKPTLLKPGAEKLITTFRLVPDPIAEDLSKENYIRYRVTCKLSTFSGVFVGAGVGECSSEENKYKWRKIISDKEWDETPEDKRRIKHYKKYDEKQVHTNPFDLANTILKMAKKRALVDAVLTVTAASDIFTQDIEDMSSDLNDMSIEPMQDEEQKGMETSPPMSDESQPPSHSSPPPEEEPQYQEKITDKQMSALYGISKGLGWAIEKVQDKAFKILGHPVGDLQSLTKRDASKLIEQLQKERAKGK